MVRAYVGVGSNIRPEENVPRALAMLRESARVVAVSTFYRTRSVGRDDAPDFWNGVVAIETEHGPRRVKESVLRPIERALGRRRTSDPNEPRTMDLDLLLHGDLVDPGLGVPDASIAEYPFVAVPLLELAPDLVVPGLGVPLREVAARLADAEMEPIPASMLRRVAAE